MGGQWAKDKKLAWQRNKRQTLSRNGFCINHDNMPAAIGHTRCNFCLKEKRDAVNKKRFELKLETLRAYGSICSCCGEHRPEFLTLEHTRRDGGKHRREIGVKAGVWFYAWLKKRGFPQDLGITVHCFNCNCSKGQYGFCPHQKERNLDGQVSNSNSGS